MYQEENLVCEDCGATFPFTTGEQEFYAEKGLSNKPKRCQKCRKNRRQGGGGGGSRPPRKLYDAVCSECGIETKVPFKPMEGKSVLCRECFQKNN